MNGVDCGEGERKYYPLKTIPVLGFYAVAAISAFATVVKNALFWTYSSFSNNKEMFLGVWTFTGAVLISSVSWLCRVVFKHKQSSTATLLVFSLLLLWEIASCFVIWKTNLTIDVVEVIHLMITIITVDSYRDTYMWHHLMQFRMWISKKSTKCRALLGYAHYTDEDLEEETLQELYQIAAWNCQESYIIILSNLFCVSAIFTEILYRLVFDALNDPPGFIFLARRDKRMNISSEKVLTRHKDILAHRMKWKMSEEEGKYVSMYNYPHCAVAGNDGSLLENEKRLGGGGDGECLRPILSTARGGKLVENHLSGSSMLESNENGSENDLELFWRLVTFFLFYLAAIFQTRICDAWNKKQMQIVLNKIHEIHSNTNSSTVTHCQTGENLVLPSVTASSNPKTSSVLPESNSMSNVAPLNQGIIGLTGGINTVEDQNYNNYIMAAPNAPSLSSSRFGIKGTTSAVEHISEEEMTQIINQIIMRKWRRYLLIILCFFAQIISCTQWMGPVFMENRL